MQGPVIRFTAIFLAFFLAVSFAAPPAPGTLGAQLALGAPGLTVSLRASDASSARYDVSAPKRVPAALDAVTAQLVTQGWLEHPNVSEAPAPKPGTVQRLQSFVQGSNLLECRAAQAGEALTLDFTLISLEPPTQVAAAP